MKRLLAFLLLGCGIAVGQGSYYESFAFDAKGHPVPLPSIRVCTSSATGTPCTPQAVVYSDVALSTIKTQPFLGDAVGNFNFYAPAGFYQVQITGAAGASATYTVLAPATGGSGSGFTWRGDWSSLTTYAANDVVAYNQSAYIAIAASTNVTPDSDLTKWNLLAQGGGSGSTNAAAQFSLPYYSAAGSATTLSGLAAPVSPNGVPQQVVSVPSGGVATAPQLAFAGISGRTVSGTTDTIVATDRAGWINYTSGSAVAVTLPQANTTGFSSNFVFGVKVAGAGSVTITPTTSTIDGGATLVIPGGQNCAITSLDNANYVSRCAPGIFLPGSFVTMTPGPSGITLNAVPALLNEYLEFTAGCSNATAFPGAFDLPTSGAAGNSCFGTTTTQGVLDFIDAATSTVTLHFGLPPDWNGTAAIDLIWFSNAASANAVRWSVQNGCVADGGALSTGPSYNAASLTNSAYTGTANQRKTTSFVGVAATNCAAGSTIYWTIQRIGADAGDTLTATAELVSARVKVR